MHVWRRIEQWGGEDGSVESEKQGVLGFLFFYLVGVFLVMQHESATVCPQM